MNFSFPGQARAALATLALFSYPLANKAEAGVCNMTTAAVLDGCKIAADADYKIATGICLNITGSAAKQKCLTRATNARTDAKQTCTEQSDARASICTAIGQAAYNPAINPADFSTTIDNPLLPMKPGDVRKYKNGDSEVTVTVTNRTIKLQGVICIVVHDVNRVSGKIEEDTFDYFAQDNDGNVWYFGEDTISYDHGVADISGSWRAGVDGAKAGIAMPASPTDGKTYRQEFSLDNAEDMARNIGGNKHVVVPYGTFNSAYQIREFTPIEPEFKEDKFYAPGVGNILAHDIVTGEREELVSFTPGP